VIKNVRAHQRAFLKQLKTRKESVLYQIQGVEIIVNPTVFPPATDTKLSAAHILVGSNMRTLDLTTGSGIFSVIAGLQGASGIAVDINLKAVKNAQENFVKHSVNMQALQSDLFSNVPSEKFDQIFANGPLFEGRVNDPLDYACYGAKKFVKILLSSVKTYLKPKGRLLLIQSEWSDLKHFNLTVKNNGLRSSLIAKRSSDDGKRMYRLYEVRSGI